MKYIYKVTFLSILVSLVSCTETKTEEPKVEEKKEVNVVEEVKIHEDIQDELHLHGDFKWEVSEHMVAHIMTIDSLVNNYVTTSGDTPNALAITVDEELKMVTQTCDMQGEAHAQLHLWLLPFWNLVDQLKESSDPELQAEILNKMQLSLVEYHTYFE